MSTVVLLAGSPSPQSKSSLLLKRASQVLSGFGIQTRHFQLSDFPPADLIEARWDSPAIKALIDALGASDGLILSTPVYKAAYSGALKTVLDLLPERALEHKAALALVTGGSPAHLLAVDYALQPVLSALKARHIVGGVYASERDFVTDEQGPATPGDAIVQRLDDAVGRLIAHLPNPGNVLLQAGQLEQRVSHALISV